MLKVLMVGPARSVKGGMTTVIDNYFDYGLDKKVELKYIESINDKGKISKFIQEMKGMHEYKKNINNYDIVHIHMASRRSTFRKLKYLNIAKKYGKKVIMHIHGGGFSNFFENASDKQKKYIVESLNKADYIITLTEEWEMYFKKILKTNNNITRVYNGVLVPENFEKKYNSSILFLGRICKNKGIYDLISAIKRVKEIYPDVTLNIGGSGEEEQLTKAIEDNDLQSNIILHGWVNNKEKEKLLIENSIFILPSYFEALPMTLLEAMSYKCIPIVSNVGALPNVVGNDGFIIEAGNIESISDAIIKVLSDVKGYQNIASNGREKIKEKYDIEVHISKINDLYNKVMRDGVE